MSGARSLVQAAGRQLDLLPSSEMEGVDFSAEERAGIYTGVRLFRDRPEIYKGVCSLVAEGFPLRMISRLLKVHHYTIQAVIEREPALIEAEKERIGGLARSVTRICMERLIDCLPEMEIANLGDAQRVAVIMGISTEKWQLLTGGATARVDHGGDQLADMRQALAALPADPVEGEFTEAAAETDLGGETCAGQKGAAVAPADLVPGAEPDRGSGAAGAGPAENGGAANVAT
jgi:hypothetical protein